MTKRIAICLALLLFSFVSCSDDDEIRRGLVVAAPESYVGGVVLVDGKEVAEFGYLETHGGLFEAVLKKVYGDSPAAHVVSARVNFQETPIPAGTHELRVEKAGQRTATGNLVLPFKGEQVQVFFVNGTNIAPPPGAARANSG